MKVLYYVLLGKMILSQNRQPQIAIDTNCQRIDSSNIKSPYDPNAIMNAAIHEGKMF